MPHSNQKPERAAILYSGSMSHTDVLKHLSDASADYVALCTFDFEVVKANEAMKVKTGIDVSRNGTILYHELIGANAQPSIRSNPNGSDNQAFINSSFESSKLGRIVVKCYATQNGETEPPGLLLIAHSMDYSSTQPASASASHNISPEQLVNALADVAFLCNAEGEIIYCSEPTPSFFGFESKSKISGSNFQSFIAYDSLDQGFISFNSVINNEVLRQSLTLNLHVSGGKSIAAEVCFSAVQASMPSDMFALIVIRPAPNNENKSDTSIRKEARMARIFNLMLENQVAPALRKLLSHFGEMLGAAVCAYSTLDGDKLNVQLTWESPFNRQISPSLGNRQLLNHISASKPEITLIRKPLLYTFLENEEINCDDAGVKALVGVPVMNGELVTGILTAVCTHNLSLDEGDMQVLKILANAFAQRGIPLPGKPAASDDLSLRELLDCFIDPVYILDLSGSFIDVNQGAVDMYGYPREKLIGQTPAFLSADGKNDMDLLQQRIASANNGETQRFDWWGKRSDGSVFPKEVVISKGIYYGREVLIAIGRDLTESKLAEERLIQSNKELLETNLSKDKFFSILAHDLKNPFQGLLGFIDLLYEDLDELSTEQIKEYLFNVRSASYHTYSLLENLLDWSRIQSGKMPFNPLIFDISDEIQSVISVLEVNSERKKIRLLNEVPKDTMIEADRNMIHSILQNLVTNSIKFSNVNGKVVIRSRVPAIVAKTNAEDEGKGKQWLEVSVADNGIGIPEELLPKLFSLNGQFSQSGTANEPGTGLGLVLCREMVEKNGGRIWAESIPGQGATFIFTVPLKS